MHIITARRTFASRKAQIAFALILAVIFAIFVPVNRAEAAGLTRGAGYKYGIYWLGSYYSPKSGSTALWCPDPNKSPASPTGSAVVSTITGANTTNVAKLNYILTVYGAQADKGGAKASNNSYAAALKLATWTYTGNKKLADQVAPKQSATVRSYYKTMVTNAEAYAGPYKLYVSLNGQPTLGKSSTITVKVVATRTGKAVPNTVINLSATNATLAHTAVSTGSTGVIKVSFTRTTWSDVKFSGITKNYLASTKIRLWKPISSTYQRFLSAAPGVKVSASASYHSTATNVGLVYKCDSNCNGVVPVSFVKDICNTYGGTARFVLLDNGVARTDMLTLAPGACGNKSWMVADTHTAQIRLDVYANGKWVSNMLPNKIIVDCPPWPHLTFNGGFDCVKGSLNLTVPAGKHAQRIIVNGVVTEKAAGQAISVPTEFSCKQANSYDVQTAVKRNNGSWNTSPTAKFAFPAIVN